MTQGDRAPLVGSGMSSRPKPAGADELKESGAGAAANGGGLARPVADGSNILRPRSFSTPAPDPAEALYYEGMAAYQHRNWEQALERFSRLKELQPTRPGLDALLDEVRWFLQLQATAPIAYSPADAGQAARAALPARRTSRMARWQAYALLVLALIGVIALLLIAFQGRLPWNTAANREIQELYERGQARLEVGDYEGAQAAFNKLLEISPKDTEAQLGLERAKRRQTLAQGYADAEAAIAEEDWDRALTELNKILAIDPSYADTQAKADFVTQRQRLASLYADGSRLYDLGQWEEAIVQFEKIQELDNTYRAEAVGEFLFVCYMNAGQAQMNAAGGNTGAVARGVDLFARGLTIHPRNRLASDAHRLGSLFLDALRALEGGDLAGAETRLNAVLGESPDYAGGAATQQLYIVLVRKAQAALDTGDVPGALAFYAQAQKLSVSDRSEAIRGEAIARAFTPTPTPRPTATPSPQPPPTPLASSRSGVLDARAGPGSGYAIIGQVAAGASVAVTGRTADGVWLRICCVSTGNASGAGREGWVGSEKLNVRGSLALAPVVTNLPQGGPATPRPAATQPVSVACVLGHVYNSSGKAPLFGWTITLQGPDGSTATRTTRTTSAGYYRFSNLPAGAYTISERVEVGWRAISPQSSPVTVALTSACVEIDFWNERSEGGPGSPPGPTPTPER